MKYLTLEEDVKDGTFYNVPVDIRHPHHTRLTKIVRKE